MSIKLRLIITYFGLLVLGFLAFFLYVVLGLYFVIKPTNDKFFEIQKLITADIPALTHSDYFAQLDQELQLSTHKSGLIVLQNNKFTYLSNSLSYFQPQDIPNLINEQEKSGMVQWGGLSYQIKYFRLKLPSDLSVTILWVANFTGPVILYSIIFIIMAVIAVIGICLLLMYINNQQVILPLDSLKNASERIRRGELNFEVPRFSKDEIGQLATALEEMRVRLKNSLEAQQQLEANRKEIVAGISRALKTPVATIKKHIEGIIDGVADSPHQLNKSVTKIYNEAVDIDHRIDELFLFSKLDLKKVTFNFELVELHQFLTDYSEELQFQLANNGATLQLDFPERKSLKLMIDQKMIGQTLTYLISFFTDHLDDTGPKQLVLSLIVTDSQNITVRVHTATPDHNIPEPSFSFEHVDQTDSKNFGLGLAISRLIIEEHHGKVWAEQNSVTGTSVVFTLGLV